MVEGGIDQRACKCVVSRPPPRYCGPAAAQKRSPWDAAIPRYDTGGGVAFTRDSFSSRLLYKKSILLFTNTPLFGHPNHPLHHPHDCAIQCFPPTILYCNSCHAILVMAISCNGQGGGGGGRKKGGGAGGGGGGVISTRLQRRGRPAPPR